MVKAGNMGIMGLKSLDTAMNRTTASPVLQNKWAYYSIIIYNKLLVDSNWISLKFGFIPAMGKFQIWLVQ